MVYMFIHWFYSSVDSDEKLQYMSRFGKTEPLVIPNCMGNFVTVQNMTRRSFSTSTSNPKALIFLPSVRGSTNAWVYDLTTGAVASSQLFSTLNEYATADTPTQIKCLRAGLKLNNTSNQQGRSSSIAVLKVSSPIEFEQRQLHH